MTEYTSSNRILGTLIQIKEAIKQLQDWNKKLHYQLSVNAWQRTYHIIITILKGKELFR